MCAARVHQLTNRLLKNKQHQLPLKSPVKTSGKGWLVYAAPLNQNQMSPQELFSLHPFLQSLIPLLFPPHSLSCLRSCRRLVLGSRDLALSPALSVFLSFSLHLQLPLGFPSLCLEDFVEEGMDLC